RLMLMTFFGEKRWKDPETGAEPHPHESPAVMTVPLIVLAALSVVGGIMLAGDWITDFLTPVVGHAEHHDLPVPVWALTLLIVATVAIGVALAWLTFGRREVPREAPQGVSPLTKAARADLYGDAINDTLVVAPTMG